MKYRRKLLTRKQKIRKELSKEGYTDKEIEELESIDGDRRDHEQRERDPFEDARNQF